MTPSTLARAATIALMIWPAVALAQTAAPSAPVAVSPSDAGDVEIAFWQSVQASDDPRLYLSYLDRYPDGAFRILARDRLDAHWERALRAFAVLEQMGISPDDPSAAATAPGTRPAAVVQSPTAVPAGPKPARNPPSWQRIRNTQNQLRAHGCYQGALDGIWGRESIKAMRRFNRLTGADWPARRPTREALKSMRTLTKSGVRVCR